MCVWRQEPSLSGTHSNGKQPEKPKSIISMVIYLHNMQKYDQLKNREVVELQAVVLVR